MAYATTLSPERLYREKSLAVQSIASDFSTGTAVAGAVTINDPMGKVTTDASSAASQAVYTLTLTNSAIAAADLVFVTVALASGTAASFNLKSVNPASGSVVIIIKNDDAAAAWTSAVFTVGYMVVKSLPTSVAN